MNYTSCIFSVYPTQIYAFYTVFMQVLFTFLPFLYIFCMKNGW